MIHYVSDSMRRITSTQWTLFAIIAIIGFGQLGCRSTADSPPKVDATLGRFSSNASEAFAEGDIDDAIEQYRKAIRRAWAIDDPYESGTNAYNLAACMTSAGKDTEAKDWLLDARTELCRAKSSAGNAWLLEAKIAQQECRFEEANIYVDRAACCNPPCEGTPGGCTCCSQDPCKESCVTVIPCVGSRIKQKKATEQCEDDYNAQIHLARARLAAEVYDIKCAKQHFDCACELASEVCSEALQAELQNVAAMIHLAKGEILQAAWHFDKEAKHLRLAGNYREIPVALELAAAAYEQSGHTEIATNRMCRVARIWYGRGDSKQAWSYVQQAIRLAEYSYDESPRIRLALLVQEIEKTLADEGQALPVDTDDMMIVEPPA
ncbi:hypothetical protein CA13_13140 [Planctomycetes bacterium CA13]|uniref:Tetratricopeptide repeat protein n=1 Tax=Novipirellula herctigrandis TaxID=2527986 RepID=A0A5C5YYX1_9BACT|nr:hypothetical protein CA13_13140 [Planctomycetes bacterium CA13]